MRWLLAGYCGLALINISVALQISQKPRFYGVMTGRPYVMIFCTSSKQQLAAGVKWYKVNEHDEDEEKRIRINAQRGKFELHDKNLTKDGVLQINDLRATDTGVYFCKMNDTWGPGTEVQVARPILRDKALYRTNMKDGLIVLQGLLLAACIAAALLRKRGMGEKNDSIYEEPETDHIYEGLAIETCGGGLYEELSVYAQPEGAEAPWE
ncbi:B-cell antigen receptor complex-associated protein beta chain [Pagrus major]|uniref:B-cell antigen receptor complex-associated protein beta chain n=1 Tax=Pagrus major TaxID=143350 RepID=UPI003CC88B5F